MALYSLILPIWLVVALALSAFCFYAKNTPSLNNIYPIAINMLIWSTVGFILANGLFWLMLFLLSLNVSSTLITSLITGLLLVVGQVGASLLGFVGGAFYGVKRAKKASTAY